MTRIASAMATTRRQTPISTAALLLLALLHMATSLSTQRRGFRPQVKNQINQGPLFYRREQDVPPSVFGAGLAQTLGGTSSDVIPRQPSHVRYRFVDRDQQVTPAAGGWKAVLQKVSTMASVLCVIDCTLLPVITIAFPLVGMAVPAEWLHHVSHAVALGFVMPVGSLTTAFNFGTHKKLHLLGISLLGLTLIGISNSHVLPIHWLHHGLGHRVTNIAGCVLLLASNYLSHRLVHQNCDC